MKKVIPYKSAKHAATALDNGGRFYNLLTKAQDGNITMAELAKTAGVFTDKQKMVLYLEMSLAELQTDARHNIVSMLSPKLKVAHSKYQPHEMTPAQAAKHGKTSNSAIVTGIPQFVESKDEFNGFIMIPISTGKTTTFMMLPLIDQYDVYHLHDENSRDDFLIAHNRGSRKLIPKSTRCGGIIKELRKSEKEKKASDKFLELLYYSPLG